MAKIYNHSVQISKDCDASIDYDIIDIVSAKLRKAKIDRGYVLSASEMKSVQIKLLDEKLWDEFRQKTTEMIVTKSGRRMFPNIKLQVSGLEEQSLYAFVLEFIQLGDNRWKFTNSQWSQGGKCEPRPERSQCIFIHSSSPAFGTSWMEKTVDFSKVKITNKPPQDGLKPDFVLLNSLHRYVPRIHVIKCDCYWECKSFFLEKAAFIAVTAYQNQNITKLKVCHNPYAKAFEKGKNQLKNEDEETNLDSCNPFNEYSMFNDGSYDTRSNFDYQITNLPNLGANENNIWSPSYSGHNQFQSTPNVQSAHHGPMRNHSIFARSAGPYGSPYGNPYTNIGNIGRYCLDTGNVQITDS